MNDLRQYVLAENIVQQPYNEGTTEITFDWLCCSCGKRHWAREIALNCLQISFMSYEADCGRVNVRMPWAETPARDEQDVYGGKP